MCCNIVYSWYFKLGPDRLGSHRPASIAQVVIGPDRMVVGFTTTCAISACHHWSCEFESRSWRGVFYTKLCDEVCQWLATGHRFFLDTPVFSTNKTDLTTTIFNWNIVESGVKHSNSNPIDNFVEIWFPKKFSALYLRILSLRFDFARNVLL
jgi:hypothetical protein